MDEAIGLSESKVLSEGDLPDSARSQIAKRTRFMVDMLSFLHPEGCVKISPLTGRPDMSSNGEL